jgi:sugar lactone lactonase YvrE
MPRSLVFLLLALLAPAWADIAPPVDVAAIPRLPVTTGWMAGTLNRGGGADWSDPSQTWVSNYTNDLAVSADGFAYFTTVWEEGNHPAAIYRNGDALPEVPGFGTDSGRAVAVTDAHVVYGRHQKLILFTRTPGMPLDRASRREFAPQPAPGEITGVAIDEARGRLYFCDGTAVRAVRLADGAPVDGFPLPLPRAAKLALDPGGHLWVLQAEAVPGRVKVAGIPFGSEPDIPEHAPAQVILPGDTGTFVAKDKAAGFVGLTFDPPVPLCALRFKGGAGAGYADVRWQVAYAPDTWTDVARYRDVPYGWPEEWLTLDSAKPVVAVRVIGPNVWLQGLEAYRLSPTAPAVIGQYAPDGTRLATVTTLPHATALAYDAHGARLLIVDGARHVVVPFTTRLDKPLGQPRGPLGPWRFTQIRGLGTDAAGNLFVATAGGQGTGQTRLECYAPDGTRRWELQGLAFLDSADADPRDPGTLFSCTNRYIVDWSKPLGTHWTWAASTVDAARFPDDPRCNGGGAQVYGVRRIGGARFLITTTQGGEPLNVFRFDAATSGDTAIPCAVFRTFNSGALWPRYQPLGFGALLWRDGNGDGRMQADEYDKAVREEIEITHAPIAIDDAGNFWAASRSRGKNRLLFLKVGEKLDTHGVPVWAWKAPGNTAYPFPAPFDAPDSQVRGFEVDAARGVLYLFGFTREYPNSVGHNSPLGRVLMRCRIDGGTLVPTQTVLLPYDCTLADRAHDQPYTAALAGDVLFVGYEARMTVLAFRADDLTLLGRIDIGEQSQTPIFDGPVELLAMRTPRGYALTMPQYTGNATTVVTWSGATAGWQAAPRQLAAVRVDTAVQLSWQADGPATWTIERRTLTATGWGPWQQAAEIAHAAPGWRDPAPPRTAAYRVRAAASDWSRTAYVR